MRFSCRVRRYCFRGAFSAMFFTTAVSGLYAASANALRSPWDGKPVAMTEAAYACPAMAHIAPDLVTDGFYRLDDPTHSIIDPVRQEAYKKSSDGVKAVGMSVVKAADDYRTTGSRKAAQCAMAQIATLAQEHSLAGKMSSNQAYYVQGWVVGAVAIAYLKVRETGIATPQQNGNDRQLDAERRRTDDCATTTGTEERDMGTVKTIICTGRESNLRRLA